jgi:L-alanine-DL-glutamate epimerase-like enolase superfamily enzyme
MSAAGSASSLRIREIEAFPVSFPVRAEDSVTLGVGRAVKRDAVIVKVTAECGLVGWGEAHHGRAPGAVARLVQTTLRQLVLGCDAHDTTGVWQRVYARQLASHGMGAAACIGLSGIDMALWDIRGKALAQPLYRLLGGASRAVSAYAGGVSLGYQPPAELVEEARPHVEAGYRAVKLRVGDSVARDVARVRAVREAFGDDLVILTDANTGYGVADARTAMPAFDALGVGWLEEPFAAHDTRSYRMAAAFGRTPLAAGENHYTRFEFAPVIEAGAVTILQPDLSKTGGITEALRIAHLASAWKLPIHPHTSMTAINMAATVHFLCAIDNAGYFEADVSRNNRFRDQLAGTPYELDRDGCVRPLEGPGIGVAVDEHFLAAHPLIDGPAYV